MTFALLMAACYFGGIIYASFFEWTLHKFVMHRPILGFSYPYRAHGITHHTVFGSAKNYHIEDMKTAPIVTMAWWNFPVLLIVNSPVGLLCAYLTQSWWGMASFLAAMSCYYGVYEYFHYCMHVPGPRWFQKTGLFKWVDQHHRLHHLEPDRNLNVVFPLADWILRTRLKRAPMAQS